MSIQARRATALVVIFLAAFCEILLLSCHRAGAQFTPPSIQNGPPPATLPTTVGHCVLWNSTNGQYVRDGGPCPGAGGGGPSQGPVGTVQLASGTGTFLAGSLVDNVAGTLIANSGLNLFLKNHGGTSGLEVLNADGVCLFTPGVNDCVDAAGIFHLHSVDITGGTITGMPSPTNPSDVANKGYVDQTELALNPAMGVQAATVTVLPLSPVYNNGVAGVGATLIAPTNGALVIDGYSVQTTDRLLIKNQSNAFENGIYTVSSAGSAGTRYSLARAVNFDTIFNINAAGISPVYHGTVGAGTQWAITSTVNTVGTDAITFTQYGIFPIPGCVAATSGSLGCVQPDNVTIGISAGVISSNRVNDAPCVTWDSTLPVAAQTVEWPVTWANYTISSVKSAVNGGGSFTVGIKINGTNVTSCSAITVSGTSNTPTTCTAANTGSVNDQITMVVSAPSGTVNQAYVCPVFNHTPQ